MSLKKNTFKNIIKKMQEGNLDKQKSSYWSLENTVKSITALIAVLGFAYGIYQFLVQQERQYRQKIYESQLEFYKDVIDLASQIAITSPDSVDNNTSKKNSQKFDEYYYGKMTFFEDTAVEKAMKDFKDIKDGYTVFHRPSVKIRDVQMGCLKLGYACRNSLQKTWGLQLQELKRNK